MVGDERCLTDGLLMPGGEHDGDRDEMKDVPDPSLRADAPAGHVRLVVCDQYPMLADGLARLLPRVAPDLAVVASCGTLSTLEEFVRAAAPHVVLAGHRVLRGSDPISVRRREFCFTSARVVVLADPSFDHRIGSRLAETAAAVISAGAFAFLPRDADRNDVIAAVRGVARGFVVVPEETRDIFTRASGWMAPHVRDPFSD